LSPGTLNRSNTAYLRGADASTILVSAADTVHNMRAMQSDYQQIGDAAGLGPDPFSRALERRTRQRPSTIGSWRQPLKRRPSMAANWGMPGARNRGLA